ncbi:MAG: ribosome maturation factor RimM [Nocardioides sp.]|uniref:ribosome maturation factor RimM n=1 Tax=Nocardioides sp. TaxID=35761 RepID=UPI0039E59CFE
MEPREPRESAETIEVMVGRIGKPHGVRGLVTIDVRTDEPERRFAPGTVLRARPARGSAYDGVAQGELTVRSARWHQRLLLAGFEEIRDRGAAEGARGTLLFVDVPTDETPADPDEFYDHQLVGLAAYDRDETPLGTVTEVVHGGAQDLLSIRTPDGRDALVPFVTQLVPVVDLAAARVVIADRPGLIAPLEEA